MFLSIEPVMTPRIGSAFERKTSHEKNQNLTRRHILAKTWGVPLGVGLVAKWDSGDICRSEYLWLQTSQWYCLLCQCLNMELCRRVKGGKRPALKDKDPSSECLARQLAQ